jgi:GT2 family glycosyltransferase
MTASSTPHAAVVVPTHNRRESLARVLDGLERQSCTPDVFEVVVVANACTDDTASYVSARQATSPFTLRLIDRVEPGAAAARNAGAERARATLLIFLDDDVEPSPDLVAGHEAAHADRETGAPPRVVMGYLPAVLQPPGDLFAITLRAWWEAMFDAMRDPGHRFAYTDLLSGNFSIARDAFLASGGFDTRYRCHEDYELGFRLLKEGARFSFAERASGRHGDATRVERACRRKRDEGHADVQLAQTHPDLRTALPLARRRTWRRSAIWRAAFHAPAFGDAVVNLAAGALPLLEYVGARMTWLWLLYLIFGYWYARGVADALPRYSDLGALLDGADADRRRLDDNRLDVPLDDGIEPAMRLLDRRRPMAAHLSLAGRPFAGIPYEAGAEPLAGRHLESALATRWYRHYVEALLEAGRLDVPGFDGLQTPGPRADRAAHQQLTSPQRAFSDASSL